MKKLLLILVLSFLLLPSVTLAWDDCPHGLVNDPYPGECSKYVDTDDDGICDRSQPAPEDRVAADVAEDQISEKTSVQDDVVQNSAVDIDEHKDESENKSKLTTAIIITLFWLVAIIAYVQYRKRK